MTTSGSLLAVLGTLGLCTTPALAGKRTAALPTPVAYEIQPLAKADKAPVVNIGESFDLLSRRHATTMGATSMDIEPTLKLRGLSESQVGQVTKSRLAEIEYCWDRLPTARRTDTTAVLKLSIDPIGTVAAIDLRGEMHGELKKCISEVANRWRFPVTDAATEIEFAVALKTVKMP